MFHIKETQKAYTFLHNVICDTFEESFPIKHTLGKYKDRLPWLTERLKFDIRLKNKMFIKSKRQPTQLNISMYKDFKRKLEKKLATAKRSYYNTKFIENRSNSKKYWELIKEIIKGNTKSQNPSHLNDSGTVITDDLDIANRFNDFFYKHRSKLSQSNTTG